MRTSMHPLLLVLVFVLGWESDPACSQAMAEEVPIKAFDIDFNWGEGGPNGFAKPGLWADASPQEHIAWYAGLGCNTIQTFAVSCNGFAWYKGGIVPEQPGLKTDFLTDMVRLGHEKDMRVMGYFCASANTRWGQEHPDLSYGAPSWPHIPFTTQYLDFLCQSIEDALLKTKMDGFMIDWVWNPGDIDSPVKPLQWLDCEQAMYQELLGEPFPGKDQVPPEKELEFRRRAIARCWERIHAAAKKAKPDCIIWLSCCNVLSPSVINSQMFKEVDWLMNEAPDPKALAQIKGMKGPQTRLIQCVVGWGDQHNAKTIVTAPGSERADFYGFAKPGPSSFPLSISEYKSKPIDSFQGNDRNIAVLARFYNGEPLDTVTKQESGAR